MVRKLNQYFNFYLCLSKLSVGSSESNSCGWSNGKFRIFLNKYGDPLKKKINGVYTIEKLCVTCSLSYKIVKFRQFPKRPYFLVRMITCLTPFSAVLPLFFSSSAFYTHLYIEYTIMYAIFSQKFAYIIFFKHYTIQTHNQVLHITK